MKVYTKGRYALRLMVDLAMYGGAEEYVSLRDAALRQDVSLKHMEQIVSMLSRHGLLQRELGPLGGYRLARPAEQYTAGEILRATADNLVPVACLVCDETPCGKEAFCATLPLWEGMNDVISEYVDGVTLADMVRREKAV